jgi:adenylate kinase
MNKRVILITGTPCVGKTTLAQKLAQTLNAQYINLTDLAEKENLTLGKDEERDTTIIDEVKMRRKLKQIIEKSSQTDSIVDGHYAAAVTPKTLTAYTFVLRRHPTELQALMQKRGYNKLKQSENLSAEILDVCLVEALQKQNSEKVCEINVTGKALEDTLEEVLKVLEGKQKCYVGCVDWLGLLEREGKIDEYLST